MSTFANSEVPDNAAFYHYPKFVYLSNQKENLLVYEGL